jgi:UDPglucose 6-dehydrogenase
MSMNNNYTVGVVGNGFVGNATAKGFEAKVKSVRVYDIDKSRSKNTFEETLNSDFVFVCLPTPMLDAEGGDCNLEIVNNFFEVASRSTECGIFILKSTVPIGTTSKIRTKYPELKIVHNPEFLTAVNAVSDFANADRIVLGGFGSELEKVFDLYASTFGLIDIFRMTPTESESVKYFANCFLATKVMMFNEAKLLSMSMGTNFEVICDAVIADRRIGETHYQVPCNGDYGFGGTCFPKDINALIRTMEENGIDPLVLKAVWKQNKNLRGNWDWKYNASAVLKHATYQHHISGACGE